MRIVVLLITALLSAVLGGQAPPLESPQPALPSGPLRFGVFTARFGGDAVFTLDGEGWPSLKGTWSVRGGEIELVTLGGPPECLAPGRYRFQNDGRQLSFDVAADPCTPRRMIMDRSTWRSAADRGAIPERPLVRTGPATHPTIAAAASALGSWPSFRGTEAAGVAERQSLPDRWDGRSGQSILWRTAIPGLGHSSPIVWGDRLFVTTAISGRPDATFKPGLYGEGDASDDQSPQRWVVYAIDKRTGRILWERVAADGEPRNKRHMKSTYASSTPATDGRVVVAWFGSQGLFAFDVDGHPLWSVDLGRLDVGAYDIPTYEWGPASSPIIWNGLVILQCDTQADSFIVALDAETGETRWRTARDELPSWGTPTVAMTSTGPELVTNASNFIRGYDPRTGRELWRLARGSKLTAPTPVFADELFVVASGRQPERPIVVVRAGSRGDITLAASASSNRSVVWSRMQRGPYMPTPLIYKGLLYMLDNNGIFDAYELKTGDEIYRQRLPSIGSGYSASPVAADGKIYLSSEDGEMLVIRAGQTFDLVATNSMGETLMATPALSDGRMYVRAARTLFAIGKK